MILKIENVEGEEILINPDQITYLKVDDRDRPMTIITLSCGTAIRTNMTIDEVKSAGVD